ncbi:ABC transporter permease [Clostridium butyricum]|uniref:ABC transporter permease n=1 Tax=Clostridium butyricum TaxID=1492 RepID=UPI0034666CF4
MSNKIIVKIVLIVLSMLSLNVLVFKFCNIDKSNINLTYDVISNNAGQYQLFYSNKGEWSEKQTVNTRYDNINEKQKIDCKIPFDYDYLRFDLGDSIANIEVSNIKISYMWKKIDLDSNLFLQKDNQNQIDTIVNNDDKLEITTSGVDPYITYKISDKISNEIYNYASNIDVSIKSILCLLIDLICIYIAIKLKSIYKFIHEINLNRKMIWSLAKNDFKTKYAGSYLGIVWAFIQPIVTILIYWFVFEFGLKSSSPIANVPFIVWLMTGLIPWFFFQEALTNATNCMLEYSYLVKKVVFKIGILPIVKIITAVFVHLVFIGFLFLVCSIYGFYPSQYTIQLIYYSLCTFVLALGISYATSAIVIFFRDLGQVISIFLQAGMWMTPIMWPADILPQNYKVIFKLNPMYYIVDGYRNTFISDVWFYKDMIWTAYFWIFTIAIFMIGVVIFKKLKPHFADVL